MKVVLLLEIIICIIIVIIDYYIFYFSCWVNLKLDCLVFVNFLKLGIYVSK